MNTPKKVLLSIALLGTLALVAGGGTNATFTDTDSRTQTIAAGTVALSLGADGEDNRLSFDADGLVPGDTFQRRVKLTNDGSEALSSMTLTTTAPLSSLLDTDATNGLQLRIDRCTGTLGWTETGSGPGPFTYTCDQSTVGDDAGTRATVLGSRAIIGADLTLAGMVSLTPGQTDDLVITGTLPLSADDSFQSTSSTITYRFHGTQRAGTSK